MSDLQDVIATNAIRAYNAGLERGEAFERQRIISLLEEKADRLDKMRPESYKRVADMADLRIRTIRKIVEEIKGEQE
jgi:hypothetical protein